MEVGKWRPQVLVAILCGTIVSVMGLWVGVQMEAVEIVTAVIGSIFGFLAGVSMKILEGE
jgi:ABC-type Mn2+/Zn2+ transport system permease subunit